MSMQRLNPHAFFNATTTAESSPWFKVDSNFAAAQTRSVMGRFSTSATDQVAIELLVVATDANGNSVSVTATATVFSGSTSDFSAVLFGPFQQIRARKVGTAAAVTLVGMV